MPTDAQLIASYRQSGEAAALDELIRRHLRPVRATVQAMVLNAADADDLTQEVFLRAFRGLAQFNDRSEFSTWLYRITMNAAHSFLARRSRLPADTNAELVDLPSDREASADRAAMRAELTDEVAMALSELSISLRGAIVLNLQGLSVKEAAKVEGCGAATMYWRLHQARKLLEQRLRKHLEP